jgi:hypothetical protein
MNLEPIFALAIGAIGVHLYQRQKNKPAPAVRYEAPELNRITPQAAAPVPAAVTDGGTLPWIAVAVLGVSLWYSISNQRDALNKPESVGILGKAFSTNDDRAQASRDAKRFGKLCASLADDIEDDAKLQSPFFKTGVQLDELRRRARIYMFRGTSLSAKYPGLPVAVDTLLTARVGTSGGPIDNEQRRKWVAAFRELAAAGEEASK